MADGVYSILDELDSPGSRHPSQRYSLLQSQSTQQARREPQPNRYRVSQYDVADDVAEEDYRYGHDEAYDSFDEHLLRQPYEDRQQLAEKGQARLSLGPQSSQIFAPVAPPLRQPSHRGSNDVGYGLAGRPGRQRQMLNQGLSQYTYSSTQPQELSSEERLGLSSSPALKAGQRRAVNDHLHASLRDHSFEDIQLVDERPPRKRRALQPQATSTTSMVKSIAGARNATVQGIPIVSISELPDRLRTIFPYPNFNAVQSKCFHNVYKSDNNFVLASPTGSGKTVILELAICRAVATNTTGQYKIVYQAPTKALCSERHRDWQKKFGQVGLICAELTGDSDAVDLRNVQSANIIITTPEKWDSVTRKWKDHEKLMRLIKVFLIDEVHILKEDRGATLEVIVSRMKSIGTDVRFIALSATVPNFLDVAVWLGRNSTEPYEPAINENFGEEFRPVKLRKHVCGYKWSNRNDFAFERHLDTQMSDVINKYSERKPIMVFCYTRNATVSTAKLLANWWATTLARDRAWNPPLKPICLNNRDLRDCAASGVAFHHAGMDINDRIAVENAFLQGDINVICCTSTLAVGVNLPCHMVIIKNTMKYGSSRAIQEYTDLEIMQMLGRAGRPQFETSAVAVIMTRQSKVHKYEQMVSGQDFLESTLHLNLIDHLNAEIGMQTITSLHEARNWLASTFLYVRLKKNAAYYKLDGAKSGQSIEEQLDDICFRDITLLKETNLIAGEENYQCTEFGHIMARYYVHFQSMRLFMGLQSKAAVSEILSAIAQASEFETFRFRSGEKNLYKVINKANYIRYRIPVNLELPPHKVSLLIQSVLGASDIPWDGELAKHKVQYNTESLLIFKQLVRLIRCIIDCQISLGDSVSIYNALLLERSVTAQVWDDSPLSMKQIEGIGVVGVRKLANAGIRSIEELECTDAHRIDAAIGRNPPFGLGILDKLKRFPKLRVSLHVQSSPTIRTMEGVEVQVKLEIGFMNETLPLSFASRLVYICLLAETSDGRKVHFARISSQKLGEGQSLGFPALLAVPNLTINCYVMCDGIAGTVRSASIKPNVAPSMFFTPSSTQPSKTYCTDRPMSNTSRRRLDSVAPVERAPKVADEFDDDDIDDDELVQASFHDLDFHHIEDYANPNDGITRKNTATNTSSKKNARSKPVEQPPEETQYEPVQLENGNWACNHSCKDKQACRHLCCKEGMINPPKRTSVKRVPSNDIRTQRGLRESEDKQRKTQSILQLTASRCKSSAASEVIDLTQQGKTETTRHSVNAPKDPREVRNLCQITQKQDPPSSISSIMYQKPAYCYGDGGQHHLSFLGNASDTNRQESVSSNYDDFQCEDWMGTMESQASEKVQTKSNTQVMIELEEHTSLPPLEDSDPKLVSDHRSDTFGDEDSMFGDAMVGLADSEYLQAASQSQNNNTRVLGGVQEPEHCFYDMQNHNDYVKDHGTIQLDDERPESMRNIGTSPSVEVMSVSPEKGRSLFLNDTSSPQLVHDRIMPGNSIEKPALSELRQAKDVVVNSAPLYAMEEVAKVEREPIPDAYKDLEPWLFEEFGDIVEIVDR